MTGEVVVSRIVVTSIIATIIAASFLCIVQIPQKDSITVVTGELHMGEPTKARPSSESPPGWKTQWRRLGRTRGIGIREIVAKTEDALETDSEWDWDEVEDMIGPIDPDSPAAPYLEAMKLVKYDPSFQQREAKIIEEGWNEEYPEILRLLETNREALTRLKAAIDRGDCYFPVPEDADFNLLMPHVPLGATIAGLLALEARFFQKEGDSENAARNIVDGIKFSHDIAGSGLLVNDSAGIVIQCDFLDIIQSEILKDQPNLDFCSAIERSLYDLEYREVLLDNSLRVEKAYMKNTFENLLSMKVEERIRQMTPQIGVLLDQSLIASDVDPETIKECIRLHEECCSEVRSALDKGLVAAIEKADELDKQYEANAKKLPRLFTLWCPSYNYHLKKKARSMVDYEMARTGVALELYAAETGNYPASLLELTPRYLRQVPVDAFSGKPLRYTRGKKDYTLYSFGYDMDDDNAQKNAKKQKYDGDIILRKERK